MNKFIHDALALAALGALFGTFAFAFIAGFGL